LRLLEGGRRIAFGAVLLTACATASSPAPEPAAAAAAQPETEAEPQAPRERASAPEVSQPFEPLLPVRPAVETPPEPDPNAPPDVAAAPAKSERSPSGLRWKVLKPGPAGGEHPHIQDTVRIHYTGWMSNGVKFDSSVDAGQPAEYVLSNVMQGWIEGIGLMVVGEKRRFWIPGNLAFGDVPRAFGRPYGTLVYDLELLHITRAPEPPSVPPDLLTPPADARRLRSGVVYRVLQPGTGSVHPGSRSTVEVHYSGWTRDGTLFDSSVVRGQTASFGLNHVIRGWSDGLQQMVVGEKARLWIPAKLAYGENPGGGSPAGALVFDVELIDIKAPGAAPPPSEE
jgi:FKBP-type peptidyl-prolyl cis-trans isomerase